MDKNKIIELISKHGKLIIATSSPIAIAATAYLTDFYKSLDKTNYYGIPVFILLIVIGITIGAAMKILIVNEIQQDTSNINIWDEVIKETNFKYKDYLFKMYHRKSGGITPESWYIYCPDCEIPLREAKTLFFGYKYRCVNCGKVHTSEYSKQDLVISAFFAYKKQLKP